MDRLIICLLVVAIFQIASCKKNDDGPRIKGCTDTVAVDYNNVANVDDGSCVYPADKLTGTWTGKDQVSELNTSTFVTTSLPEVTNIATVKKESKTQISIAGDRPDKPIYIYTGRLTLNWKAKTVSAPGTSISGTIMDDNSFSISYVYGEASIAYIVTQTFTR